MERNSLRTVIANPKRKPTDHTNNPLEGAARNSEDLKDIENVDKAEEDQGDDDLQFESENKPIVFSYYSKFIFFGTTGRNHVRI